MKKITLLLLATTTVAFPMDNPEEGNPIKFSAPSSTSGENVDFNIDISEAPGSNAQESLGGIDQQESAQEVVMQYFSNGQGIDWYKPDEDKPEAKSKIRKIAEEYLTKRNLLYTSLIVVPVAAVIAWRKCIETAVDNAFKAAVKKCFPSSESGN